MTFKHPDIIHHHSTLCSQYNRNTLEPYHLFHKKKTLLLNNDIEQTQNKQEGNNNIYSKLKSYQADNYANIARFILNARTF